MLNNNNNSNPENFSVTETEATETEATEPVSTTPTTQTPTLGLFDGFAPVRAYLNAAYCASYAALLYEQAQGLSVVFSPPSFDNASCQVLTDLENQRRELWNITVDTMELLLELSRGLYRVGDTGTKSFSQFFSKHVPLFISLPAREGFYIEDLTTLLSRKRTEQAQLETQAREKAETEGGSFWFIMSELTKIDYRPYQRDKTPLMEGKQIIKEAFAHPEAAKTLQEWILNFMPADITSQVESMQRNLLNHDLPEHHPMITLLTKLNTFLPKHHNELLTLKRNVSDYYSHFLTFQKALPSLTKLKQAEESLHRIEAIKTKPVSEKNRYRNLFIVTDKKEWQTKSECRNIHDKPIMILSRYNVLLTQIQNNQPKPTPPPNIQKNY